MSVKKLLQRMFLFLTFKLSEFSTVYGLRSVIISRRKIMKW